MRKVLASIVILFLLLQIINIFSRFIIFDRTSYEPILGTSVVLPQIFNPWLNFDGLNYLSIAKFGYSSKDLLVFFPLYPLVVRILSFGGYINQVYLGLFLSFVFTLCSLLILYHLVKKNENEGVALKTIFVILLFPTSFFLFAFYAEGLFLLILALFFWSLNKRVYWFSFVLVMFAMTLKIFGLAMLLPLIYNVWRKQIQTKEAILALLIVPLGLVAYFYFVFTKFGNPLLVFTGQGIAKYSRFVGFLSPFEVAADTFAKITRGPKGYDNIFSYPVIILETVTILSAISILLVSYKKIRLDYWLFCLAVVLIIIFSGGLSSDLRYVLILFPLHVFIAKYFRKKALILWFFVSSILLVFCSTLYLRNYWIA